mgnify:CR=1 FL=1
MTLFEMIKTRPYEMQQEFSCGGFGFCLAAESEEMSVGSHSRGKAETVSDVSGENVRDGRLFYSCLTSGEFGRQASGNALFFCSRW